MITILIVLAVCAAVPSVVAVISAAKMTGKESLIKRAGAAGLDSFAHVPGNIRAFIAAHELIASEVLQFSQIPFAIYRWPEEPGQPERYLMVMMARGRYVCDLTSDFSATESLTTVASADLFVYPRLPGAHAQGFPKASLEQLWLHHLESELYLLDQRKVTLGRREPDLLTHLEQTLRRQGEFIKATPLYWLKAPYWFYVKRHRMANRTVPQQLEAGSGRFVRG
jgi:hypothetical protein